MKTLQTYCMLGLLLFLCGSVSAGLGKDYLKNNTLLLYPGQTFSYNYFITNTDKTPINFLLSLDDPANISKLANSSILMPAETYNVPLPLEFHIAKGTPIGTQYKISLKMAAESKAGGGMIPIVTETGDSLKVLVVPQSTTTTLPLMCPDGYMPDKGVCVVKTDDADYTLPAAGFLMVCIIIVVFLMVRRRRAAPIRTSF